MKRNEVGNKNMMSLENGDQKRSFGPEIFLRTMVQSQETSHKYIGLFACPFARPPLTAHSFANSTVRIAHFTRALCCSAPPLLTH